MLLIASLFIPLPEYVFASFYPPSPSEQCYAVTMHPAVGPYTIPKGVRRIIVNYDMSTDSVIVYKMGGPYKRKDFKDFSSGCSTIGLP